MEGDSERFEQVLYLLLSSTINNTFGTRIDLIVAYDKRNEMLQVKIKGLSMEVMSRFEASENHEKQSLASRNIDRNLLLCQKII